MDILEQINLIIEADRDETALTASSELTARERLFVLEYLNCWNVKRAGLRCGMTPETAKVTGYSLLKKPHVQAAIQDFLEARALSAAAVVDRLMEIGFADYGDFITVNPNNGRVSIDLAKAAREGSTAAIKRVKVGRNGVTEVELHDPVRALELMAKYLNMLTENKNVTINWKNEAASAGLNADTLREQVKQYIALQLSAPKDSSIVEGEFTSDD